MRRDTRREETRRLTAQDIVISEPHFIAVCYVIAVAMIPLTADHGIFRWEEISQIDVAVASSHCTTLKFTERLRPTYSMRLRTPDFKD